MKRIKLTHGSARVSDNITDETKEALNKLTELAYEQGPKQCDIHSVTCRFLEVGDVIYNNVPNGIFSHQRKWLEVKVLQTSKTLAYCDNGMKVYREPKPRTNGGYRYLVKNGGALYPNKNGR